MKFNELDVVRTLADFTKDNIFVGDTGTIVSLFEDPCEAYLVEFVNQDGSTKAMLTILPEDLEVVKYFQWDTN